MNYIDEGEGQHGASIKAPVVVFVVVPKLFFKTCFV